MNSVLADSSVWIDYFRGSGKIDSGYFNSLIDNNQACTNDLILAELIPFMYLKKQKEAIEILQSFRKIPLQINWDEIIDLQANNLKHGINNVGIPDLIILQNVMNNSLSLYTLDKHFTLMQKHVKFSMIEKAHP